MKKDLIKDTQFTERIDSAKTYMEKYVKELKLHFDLSDNELKTILLGLHNSIEPINPILKCLSMIKFI